MTEARDAEWTPSKGEGLCEFARSGSSHSETPAAFGLTVTEPDCGFIVSRLSLPSHNRVKYLTLILSIMSIIRGPIFISAVNLPDAISHRLGAVSFACAVLFCGRSRHLIGLQARRLTCIHAKTAPHSAIVVSSSTSRTWRVISFGAARLQIRFRQNFRNFRQNCRLYISHFRV